MPEPPRRSLVTVGTLEYFAPTVKLIRTLKGLEQKDVVERSGLTKAMVSQLERGKQRPSLATLEKYLEGLGVTFRFYLYVSDILWEIDRFVKARDKRM